MAGDDSHRTVANGCNVGAPVIQLEDFAKTTGLLTRATPSHRYLYRRIQIVEEIEKSRPRKMVVGYRGSWYNDNKW